MVKPSEGKLLYHITHLNNMPSIFKHGLLSRCQLRQNSNLNFVDIADQEILAKRENYGDPPSQYVLFHFYPKNPFDFAVCHENHSENMVLITIRRSLCISRNSFFIIPSHPLDIDQPEIYPYKEGISRIRWDILDAESTRDYDNAEIRKACMAECITLNTVPVKDFAYLYVYNKKAKEKLQNCLNYTPTVDIQVNPFMFP